MKKNKNIKPSSNYYSRTGDTGYPIPSINNPYVYLQSLLSESKGAQFRVGQRAKTLLNHSDIRITNQSIDSGLEFLKEVAIKQREHERVFIEEKIKRLAALGDIGKEEQEIIDQLKNMNYNFENNNFNYKTFIIGLNMVITNIEKYKSRIQGFNKTTTVNTPQLNLVTSLDTMIGDLTNKRGKFILSQEELIRQLAILFLTKEGGKGQQFIKEQIIKKGPDNIVAALAMITQQLARFIYDTGKLKYKKGQAFKDENEFIQYLNELSNSFEEFANNSNIESIYTNQQLLNEIKELYGIEITKKNQFDKNITKKASKKAQELQKALKLDNIFDKNFKALFNKIKVNFKYKQHQLSYQNELVSALFKGFDSHYSIGSRNMADDMLLGWLSVDIEEEPTNNQADKVAQTLKRIADKIIASGQNNNNLSQTSNIYIDELTKLSKNLTELEHGFIIHESTKNYNTLERGRWPRSMKGLSGREMKLLNYIEGIELLGNITHVNTDSLKFSALNLSSDALGDYLKDPLEKFFTIFAGIMMFDDFAIIGREVTQQMQFSNIDSLHLYRLQDTYFPASIFLDATYKALKGLEEELLSGNGFTTTIKIPTINYYKANNVPDTSYGQTFSERWEGVREYAEKNTIIYLHFAANFLSLMKALL